MKYWLSTGGREPMGSSTPPGKMNRSKRRSRNGADQVDAAFIRNGTLKARTGAKIARSRNTRTQPNANIAMRFFCSWAQTTLQ